MVKLFQSRKGEVSILQFIVKFVLYALAAAVVLGILITGAKFIASKIVGTETTCDCMTGENCNEQSCNNCPLRTWEGDKCKLAESGGDA